MDLETKNDHGVSYRVSDERLSDRRLERWDQTVASDRYQTGGDLPVAVVGEHKDRRARFGDGRGALYERHYRRRRRNEDILLTALVGQRHIPHVVLCRHGRDASVGHTAVDA